MPDKLADQFHRRTPVSRFGTVAVMAAGGLLFGGAAAAAAPSPQGKGHSAASANGSRIEVVRVAPSADAARLLKWVVASGDNLGLPFLLVDKVHAQAMAFNPDGSPRGSAAALVGLGRGDVSPPGIGQRRLADIPPGDRITPAGRFIAALGNDLGVADILWVDYDAAISLHRVITGNPRDRRRQRLATVSAADNRITYGCINVPIGFFDTIVRPLFSRTNGLVYILPEAKPLDQVFAVAANATASEAKEFASRPPQR